MNLLPKIFLVIAATNGMVAVILGAFGAHALKARLDENALAVWHTAVQYHFVHTLALFALSILMQQNARSGALTASAVLFTLGLLFFSGSLYLLALGGPRWLGPITPLGGAFFIAAWASLLVYALSR